MKNIALKNTIIEYSIKERKMTYHVIKHEYIYMKFERIATLDSIFTPLIVVQRKNPIESQNW